MSGCKAFLNSSWMRLSAGAESASKRSTITGVVFDARARPKPSAYSTRTPSIVRMRSAPGKGLEAWSLATDALDVIGPDFAK